MPLFYAHTHPLDSNHWQSIQDHLEKTARLAREMGLDAGVAEFAEQAALLHDIGKYSQAFQNRLKGAKIRVDHSTAGAQEIRRLKNRSPQQKYIGEILAYCIAGHHGGLPDYGSEVDTDDEATLKARFKRHVEPYDHYAKEVNTAGLMLPMQLPIQPIPHQIGFSVSFFTRMIYSALVDGDFLETEQFMQGPKPRGGYASIAELCGAFNQFLKGFDRAETEINRQRTSTLRSCVDKAADAPGLFTLTVPTGGGKTFASMAFALNHAAAHGLKRVIYVIPYTSIIEQNAAEFKKCLGSENVLEHHSNFDWREKDSLGGILNADDQTNDTLSKLRLAAENWDIPIVVTTNVQFFESLFSNRSSRCRKLHNIAKSVIIFDEAQMLPREYLKPCLYGVYELVKNYGASAVFCTATQPDLSVFMPEGVRMQELVPNPGELFDFYRRVKVEKVGKLPDADLIEQINVQAQVLCIVNTRKHARGLFEKVIPEGRYHLSTLMCPAHRRAVLLKIRERLKKDLPCRVISTQIMEAGIDVDFPVGYRALAGLDSIIQAAGRINREAKRADGKLFLFEPVSEFVKRTPGYIRQGAEVAQKILRQSIDPIGMQAIQQYYSLLYDLTDPQAFDRQGILDCFDKGDPTQPDFDFKTAADKFKLIEDDTVAVIVLYNEVAEGLIAEMRTSLYPQSFARKLQSYTVNIYQPEFLALQSQGKIDWVNEMFNVLNDKSCYHPETGLMIPMGSGDAVFF